MDQEEDGRQHHRSMNSEELVKEISQPKARWG
jgi:hypothetical protein